MNRNKHIDLSRFFVAGINYKKTNDQVRGSFAINRDQYESILNLAPAYRISEMFILSTCNRTEIYGFADGPDQLMDLVCSQTAGTREAFSELAYVKSGFSAIEQLFLVAAGLDSQILGDYEIVGQIRQAVRIAREKGFIQHFLDRLTNQVLQASKSVKNQTAISDGTVSVSFAAVQYIREHFASVAGRKILLVGVGKIGRNTCKNLKDYLETNQITLINRSPEKASELAGELGLAYASLDQLGSCVQESDIILVASNSPEPVILKSHLENKGEKLLIDLSIPYNIDQQAAALPGITLVTIDDLSKLKDQTLQKREAEVPKARKIIEEHLEEFREWLDMRKHVVVLKAIKTKLKEIHTSSLSINDQEAGPRRSEDHIQRVINGMATKIRHGNKPGCNYIEAINEYMATGTI